MCKCVAGMQFSNAMQSHKSPSCSADDRFLWLCLAFENYTPTLCFLTNIYSVQSKAKSTVASDKKKYGLVGKGKFSLLT